MLVQYEKKTQEKDFFFFLNSVHEEEVGLCLKTASDSINWIVRESLFHQLSAGQKKALIQVLPCTQRAGGTRHRTRCTSECHVQGFG